MRRLWLLLAFALTALPSLAQQTFPPPAGYVDDFAHVLDPGSAALLEAEADELHDKTHGQVFVVTVDSLNGIDIKPFANDLFHTWKIGEKGTDRGVLILFAIKDHTWRIEVGYGFEGILNDAKVGDIGRSVVPELKAGDYDTAAGQAFAGVAAVIAADSHVTLATLTGQPNGQAAGQPDPVPVSSPGSGMTGCYILFFLGLFGFLALILLILVLRGRAGGSSGPSPPYVDRPSSSRFTSSDSSSSSSWSSSSSSSSADSSSFSGGEGGDSGGGGADGSW